MSINREKIKQSFIDYTDKYDSANEQIALKVLHTFKVAELSEMIAESLQLTQEDVDLAWIIGMLHDIGRFEQVRRYGTFADAQSIDHAAFGRKLLFEEGLIEQFGSSQMTEEELKLIEKAVHQHNWYRIGENLSEREAMFCNIIRDADKVDIFRVIEESSCEAVFGVSEDAIKNSKITEPVMDCFMRHVCVDRNLRITPADKMVGHISLFFELVYPASREAAIDQGYLQKMLEFEPSEPETKEAFEYIRKEVKNFEFA